LPRVRLLLGQQQPYEKVRAAGEPPDFNSSVAETPYNRPPEMAAMSMLSVRLGRKGGRR
jgi:hypothetical protein